VLPIALKWKDNEDRDSYPSVNKQMLGGVSDHENKVLLQTYENSESGDHIKSYEINKLSGNNRVQPV
jgi:hypothetical protein